jgi:hypothetical protein
VVGKKREREKVAMEKKGGKGSLEPLAEVNPVSSSVLLSSHSTPEQKDGHGNSINDETGGGAYV